MMRPFRLGLLTLVVGAATLASAQTVINYWTHEDPNRTRLEERYIAEFEAANPDIIINRVTQPSDPLPQLILTAFAAGRGPDIFGLASDQLPPYIVYGRAAAVNPSALGYADTAAIVANYLEGTLDPVMYEGGIYGIPFEVTNWAIFMNDKVFRDAGLDPDTDYPKTFEELVEVSEKIAIRDGEVLLRRGFDFRYPYYLTWLVPMVEQLGGSLFGETEDEILVNEEAWLKVLRFFQEWGPHGRNLGSPTYPSPRSRFNHDNNDIGMATSGLYQIARIKNDNPEFYASGDWRVIPWPVFEDAVNDVANAFYGMYWMVNAESNAATQEAAWKFIGYMAARPLEFFEAAGLVQPVTALLESQEYRDYPFTAVFDADIQRAKPLYAGEHAARIQTAIQDAVEAVMLQGRSPESVLPVLRDDIKRALEGRL